MPICRYFQQGNCRFGNRCRNEHVYAVNPNQQTYYAGGNYANYSGGGYSAGNYYGGGGGNNFGGYRGNSGSGGYSNNYTYGNGSYSPGGGGDGGSGGSNERAGTSILRAKAGTQYQNSGGIFGQPPASATPFQPQQGFFTPNAADTKTANPVHDLKEIMQMIINEFSLWDRSGQWPLSCFSLFKEQGCFPGLIDHSPEEIRWYMYQARSSGNLQECQQQIKGMYDKAKMVKEQLMTPSAETIEILSRLSRGEKIEAPSTQSFSDNPSSAVGVFGANNGANAVSSEAANSFTFTLPNKASVATNQGFSVFGAPPMNAFSNVSSSLFGNISSPKPSQNIFGGASQALAVQTGNPPAVENGLFGSHSNSQNINDTVTYTPLEEMSEEMINTFNAPVYSMGSVPIKPPPKELCGLRS